MAVDVLKRENKHTQQWARRVTEHDVKWNGAMRTCSCRRWSLSYNYWHETRDGSTLFIKSQQGNNSSCITTDKMWKVCMHWVPRQLMEEHRKKLHRSSPQLPYSIKGGWEWLTRANNYQRWKLDLFLRAKKKIGQHGLEKKKEEEVPRKFKNAWSARQMLRALWDCCGLVYAEFGPDAHKEK